MIFFFFKLNSEGLNFNDYVVCYLKMEEDAIKRSSNKAILEDKEFFEKVGSRLEKNEKLFT